MKKLFLASLFLHSAYANQQPIDLTECILNKTGMNQEQQNVVLSIFELARQGHVQEIAGNRCITADALSTLLMTYMFATKINDSQEFIRRTKNLLAGLDALGIKPYNPQQFLWMTTGYSSQLPAAVIQLLEQQKQESWKFKKLVHRFQHQLSKRIYIDAHC